MCKVKLEIRQTNGDANENERFTLTLNLFKSILV